MEKVLTQARARHLGKAQVSQYPAFLFCSLQHLSLAVLIMRNYSRNLGDSKENYIKPIRNLETPGVAQIFSWGP